MCAVWHRCYIVGPGVNISDTNFAYKDLSGLDLTRAILTRANLTNAILTNANLTGADLTDTILTGANLTGVTYTVFEVSYSKGWNLFSLPFQKYDKTNMSIEDIFPADDNGSIPYVTGTLINYDKTNSSYTKTTEIDPTKTYWLQFTKEGTSTISTIELKERELENTILVTGGWNLINVAKDTNLKLESENNLIEKVQTYNNETQQYEKIESNDDGTYPLQSTKGYWVRMTLDTEATLTFT